jgi:xanthine dehydrogenase YagS FAD-binding subunit
MRPFAWHRAETPDAAVKAAVYALDEETHATPPAAPVQFIAGGTTMLDLMKLDVMQPRTLIDISGIGGAIEAGSEGLRLGALVRMAEAADHPLIRRDYPVIAQSLALAASQQLRNMATLGGNVLQRTRCAYFRDVSYAQCNKRHPGSGCAALEGVNRQHAVLGTSEACISTYAGDFAQALIALDAQVEVVGPKGRRSLPFSELHRLPGERPNLETVLSADDLIAAFTVPAGPWTRRSLYLKIRDRESYAFALASAAVALDVDASTVRQVRIGLGGVATVPWRAREAEEALRGRVLDEESARTAAEAAFAGARGLRHNAFKIELGKRTLVRALLEAARMELPA